MQKITLHVKEFDEQTKNILIQSIDYCNTHNQKILPIYINSGGGSVAYLLSMVDHIEKAKVENNLKIVTITDQLSLSAGAVLFAVGDKRYISKNATLMIHDVVVNGFAINQKSKEGQANQDFINNQREKILNILDTGANQKSGYFETLLKEKFNTNVFMTSEQALEHKLATNIDIPTKDQIFNAFDSDQDRIQNLLINSIDISNIDQFISNNNNETEVLNVDLKEAQERIKALEKTNNDLVEVKNSLETDLNASKSQVQLITLNQVKQADNSLLDDWIINNKVIDKSKEETAKKLLEIANKTSEAKEIKSLVNELLGGKKALPPTVNTSNENNHVLEPKIKNFSDFCEKNKVDINNLEAIKEAEIKFNLEVK